MLIRQGLTAICCVAGLAMFAPNALADHHHQPGAMMRDQGMMGPDGKFHPGRMMDRDMMRRHMGSEKRSEKRSKRRRHHRDRRYGGMHHGNKVRPISHLTIEDVRHHFEHRLQRRGNDRLKVGEVKKIDDDTITADIVTVDNSLVRRLRVDRHSGRISRE
jgi:hypothetical protein